MNSVKVSAIKDTKNPAIKQLELRTNIEKPIGSNPVAFFLEGIPNVSPTVEKRVAYQSVSTDFIKKHNIEVGTEFTSIIPCQLVVKESTTPRTWLNSDNTKGQSQPKINPSTSEVLKNAEGQEIFRDTILDITMLDKDVYIKHVSSVDTAKAAVSSGAVA